MRGAGPSLQSRMNTTILTFFLVLATFLGFAPAASSAASPGASLVALPAASLAGTYEVTTTVGGPPIANATVSITIVQIAPATYVGVVTVDYGQGPVPLAGENMLIVGSGNSYNWQNERGTTGQFTYLSETEWRSEVLTGRNAGTVRVLQRCY